MTNDGVVTVRALAPGSVAALVERRGKREPDDDGLRAKVRAVLEDMLAEQLIDERELDLLELILIGAR